jgi:hypothetical protein
MKPRFISPKEMSGIAEAFLKKFNPSNSIPVDIDFIAEKYFGIDIVPSPGLMHEAQVDALTSMDLTQINIDEDKFKLGSNRARFSIAHELGHIYLHKDYILSKKFSHEKDWREFILTDLHRDPMETQANMFAAHVLMPKSHMAAEFAKARESILEPLSTKEKKMALAAGDKALAAYVARSMAKVFDVSEVYAKNRAINWLENGY